MGSRAQFGKNHFVFANEKFDAEQTTPAQIIGYDFRHVLGFFRQRAHVEMTLFANFEIAINLLVFNHRSIGGFHIFLPDS